MYPRTGSPWCCAALHGAISNLPLRRPVRAPAVLGKVEGVGEDWHGHVTAVTVSPTYRRQRLADKLMALLEDVTIKMCVLAGGLWVGQRGSKCCSLAWLTRSPPLTPHPHPLPAHPRPQARRLLCGPVCARVQCGGYRHVHQGAPAGVIAATAGQSTLCIAAPLLRSALGAGGPDACAARPSLCLQFGYSVYRKVLGYYSNEEDAYGEQEGGRGVGLPVCLGGAHCGALG